MSCRLRIPLRRGFVLRSPQPLCTPVSPKHMVHTAASTPATPAWPALGPVYNTESNKLTELVSDELKLPRFPASADAIVPVDTPRQFYGLLKTKIMQAKERIFIATLYIGKEEKELLQVTILMDAMRATRESPKSVSSASLLSHLAAMFPDQVDIRLYATPLLRPNSFKSRLIGKRFNEGFGLQHMKVYGFDDDVIISGANLSRDYFTRRQDRYVMVRHHAQLADYLNALVLLICRFSYALQYNGNMALLERIKKNLAVMDDESDEIAAMHASPFSLTWDGGVGLLNVEDADGTISSSALWQSMTKFPERDWARLASHKLHEFTARWYERTQDPANGPTRYNTGASNDTHIVPLLQMGQLGITQEAAMIPYMSRFLGAFRLRDTDKTQEKATDATYPYTVVDITSGYFSLSGVYKSLVLSPNLHAYAENPGSVPVCFRLVAASPEANGFFGSRGISGRIPAAYTYLERRFWEQVVQKNLARPLPGQLATALPAEASQEGAPPEQYPVPTIELREWRKYGWTYHQKGVWITPPSSSMPSVTLIGSSNYGARSEKFDLECSLLVSTTAPKLRKTLQKEVLEMRYDARDVIDSAVFASPERKVDPVTRILTNLFQYML
ncbi:CDP-diacylglycerol--glycerol-3-phosphate 1-phosphatidyltransferase [Malassezia vespertilionis]|uniref:CDP-diacylglycerol--glycerol-3-phosphate 1-phosphatidyltransferase n=1 Tax=Malassezia vespertilionis TaxID=2020962 RepID=UPI0024B1CEA2|nr:CDP-diacylglycerol--glycerol-3-phosphate 1-phosphatidyltransferase [Malassezia vespertilionis]WFD08173.1 CDP-diacylglycerol--glycerol-3-phosphate 1-phosphatidyltransferase [Malassezia vespertilionis]